MSDRISNERKLTAPAPRAEAALALLRHVCHPDPAHPFGLIRSIYLDRPSLPSYREKVEGDHLKAKFRLRWYAAPQPPRSETPDLLTAFLERKRRIGSGRAKERRELALERAWIENAPLDDPRLETTLRTHLRALEDPGHLDAVPMIRISYERHRFVCTRSGARVCLDRDIRADRLHPAWLPALAPASLQTIVCEVKDRGFGDLPWAADLVAAGFRMRSFSKFGECMMRTLNGGEASL